MGKGREKRKRRIKKLEFKSQQGQNKDNFEKVSTTMSMSFEQLSRWVNSKRIEGLNEN